MRREQLNLFLYDWDYITQTYKGLGWLGRFLGDFTDQFLYFKVIGPVLVALVLTGIGSVTYRICRHGLGKTASLGIAAVVFAWSLLRESENLFLTQYSLVTLGYLALVLAALQFRRIWMRAAAGIVFLAIGIWSLGSPCQKYYGKLWGVPNMVYDKMIALDVEGSRGHWDKVLKLSEKALYINEASYYYNLACAMTGQLGDKMLDHSQRVYGNSLFLWVREQVSPFSNGIAGEVWYHLGDMTLAEQSAIVALQASPKHTGARYLVRLAEINLISGEYGAAQKYLNMLSKTLNYRRWARRMMPQNHSEAVTKWLTESRSKLADRDVIYGSSEFRPLLLGLLEANPDNYLAQQYLLAYDMMCFDLESFVADYGKYPIQGRMYQEALVIWLSMNNNLNDATALSYGISKQTLQRLNAFYKFPGSFKNSYWYFYSDPSNQ